MLRIDSRRLHRRLASAAAGAGTVAVLLSARTAFADPMVSINAPAAAAVVGDTLNVSATVTSIYLLGTVHAQAQGAGVDLACDNAGVCTGTLDLSAVPTGPLNVVVTATDVTAASGNATVAVVHDHAPTIAVQTVVGAVARPMLRLKATCSDADAYGCATVTASINGGGAVLASSNGGVLDQVLSLAAYDNKKISIEFKATDTLGLTATKTIEVYVDTSPYFQEIVKGDGPIVDVDATRILFSGASSLVIRPWAAGADTPVAGTGSVGFLTQLGAIWPGGELHSGVTETNNAEELVANATYAAWNSDTHTTAWYRDIVAGVTTQIPPGAAVGEMIPTDVAANGDALFDYIHQAASPPIVWSVYRYRAGSFTMIPSGPNSYNRGKTDGTSVVFQTRLGVGSPATVWFNSNGTDELLSSANNGGCHPGEPLHLIRSGWTLFGQIDYPGCVWTLRTRAPNGVIGLVSPFATDSYGMAVAEDGEVIFSNGPGDSSMYRGRAGSLPTKVDDNALGRFYRINSKWYRTIGASLFELVTPSPLDGGADGGGDASADAAADASTPDGSASDAATPGADAGSGSSGSSGSSASGGPIGGGGSDGSDPGAGCSLTGRDVSQVPVALGLLFAASAIVRRRRRR
jgi:hypothetical protein